MTLQRRIVNKERNLSESTDYRTDESYLGMIRTLGLSVVMPGSVINFATKDKGGVYIPAGDYGGFTVTEARQVVSCAPGSRIGKIITVDGSLVISGAIIDCEAGIEAVRVRTGGRLILSGCHISKADGRQSLGSGYIVVDDGGYASINNCFFHGLQSDVGSIVINNNPAVPPGPGRVAVVGCVNLTDIVTAPYPNVGYVQDVP